MPTRRCISRHWAFPAVQTSPMENVWKMILKLLARRSIEYLYWLTIANQPYTFLLLKCCSAKVTRRIVVTVFKPLDVRLHNTLWVAELDNTREVNNWTSFMLSISSYTFGWLVTMQCSQTLTRCSKQNWLVTWRFGHLQRPIIRLRWAGGKTDNSKIIINLENWEIWNVNLILPILNKTADVKRIFSATYVQGCVFCLQSIFEIP